MTQIDLDRLRELLAKGTQGEWYGHRVSDRPGRAFLQFRPHPDFKSGDVFCMGTSLSVGGHASEEDVALIAAAVNAVEPLVAEVERLRALVAELTDPDPCEYDHHGNCQAHSLHSRPCPHERAKAVLEEKGGAT